MSESTEPPPDYPRLPTPPIIEAIVSLNCQVPEKPDVERILPIARDRFAVDFPNTDRLTEAEATFTIPPSGEHDAKVQGRPGGFRLLDARPPSQVLHLDQRSFTFNKLKPYDSLDAYLETIAEGWHFYRKHFEPKIIDRIGLRYVNRIELPLQDNVRAPLGEYFTSMPRLEEDPAGRVMGVFQTLRFQCVNTGFFTQVAFATEDPKGGKLPILLDIESFAQSPREPDAFEAFHDTIEALRSLKNKYFYSSLSETCLDLFR